MTITLQWDDNPAEQLVGSYNVYQTVDGGMQTLVGSTEVSEFVLEDPAPGNYVFNVSAVNLAGEGPQSAPAVGPSVPGAPTNVTISINIV